MFSTIFSIFFFLTQHSRIVVIQLYLPEFFQTNCRFVCRLHFALCTVCLIFCCVWQIKGRKNLNTSTQVYISGQKKKSEMEGNKCINGKFKVDSKCRSYEYAKCHFEMHILFCGNTHHNFHSYRYIKSYINTSLIYFERNFDCIVNYKNFNE